MLKDKLLDLREKIIYESSLVEKMINLAIDGLLENDLEKLDNALRYETLINQQEIEIDEMCVRLIALFHPEARELRTIISILGINTDFERMGDLATTIIYSAKYLIDKPPLKTLISIPNMAKETIKMIKDALTSFIDQDAVLARQVCKFDDIIDAYRDEIIRDLITYMISDTQNIERCLKLLLITQNLERIADHCTNVAEHTVFMKDGRLIKHNNAPEQ